ncbi:MAG TPA: hypothetical protein DCM73_00485 [Clostridiales bacterium]|nr:hypothetical protein [Clostridiales bacterium]
MNKIEFKNVSFSYSEDKEILKAFSAVFYKKDTIAVMGRSGIGKSTLMNMLINFLEHTSGDTEKTLIQSIERYLFENDSITFIVSHKKEILKTCNKVIYFTEDGVKLLNLNDDSDLKSFRAINVNA